VKLQGTDARSFSTYILTSSSATSFDPSSAGLDVIVIETPLRPALIADRGE